MENTVIEKNQNKPGNAISGKYRVVSSSEGASWLKDGVHIVKRAFGSWMGISAFLIFMMLIPIVNIITAILIPVAVGGIMIGCKKDEQRLGFTFDHLFEGLKDDAKELLTLSAYYALASILVNLLTYLLLLAFGIDYQELLAQLQPPAEMKTEAELLQWTQQLAAGNTLLYVALGMLISLALFIPVLMAIWFAPALIVFQKMSAISALLASYKACHKNFKPFLVFGVAGLGYLLVGYFLIMLILALVPVLGIPLFLFSFVAVFAISLATIYPSYKSVFVGDQSNGQDQYHNESDSSMLA
jgi:uncharacterized membrane protein